MPIPDTIDHPAPLSHALLLRLCTPANLDPCNPIHRAGFARALRRDPTLPIPPGLLDTLSDRELWQVVQQPPAAYQLKCRLSDPDNQVDTPTKDDEITMTPLLPSLEVAIIDAYQARRLKLRDVQRLEKRFILRRSTLQALHAITYERETHPRRRTRQPSAAPPSLLERVNGCLVVPNTSGASWQLWNLPLEHLIPEELAQLLPQWLTLGTRYISALLNVPGLDVDTQALAFRAWIEHHCHQDPRQPIPLHLVEALPASSLASVLRGFFRDAFDITPPPTQHCLDNFILVVALDDPEPAADLRTSMLIATWQNTLFALIEADIDAPTATDPDARWVALAAKQANQGHTEALQLYEQFNQWPPARQRALAPIFLATITFTHLI